MSKSEVFAAAVRSLGHAPRIDSDGDIFFDADGFSHVLYATEDDTEFLRLAIPNVRTLASDTEYWPALQAANTVNRHMKVAKAYLYDQMVVISAENLLPTPDGVYEVLDQLLYYAHAAVTRFHQELQPK